MRFASSLLSAVVCVALMCVCFTAILSAQDAAKVDARHYTVLGQFGPSLTGTFHP